MTLLYAKRFGKTQNHVESQQEAFNNLQQTQQETRDPGKSQQKPNMLASQREVKISRLVYTLRIFR